MIENSKVSVIAGCGQEGIANGSSRNATFLQPTGVCVEQGTLFVTNSVNGSVRLITQTSAMCKFLGQIQLPYRTFGVHLKGSPAEHHSLDEVIKAFEGISQFWTRSPADIQSYTGMRRVVQVSRSCYAQQRSLRRPSITSVRNSSTMSNLHPCLP